MGELVILVPVLRRPHRVAPLLRSIEAATPAARVIFLADPHDRPECAAIRRERRETPLRVEAIAAGGNYASKINRGVRESGEPLIFLGADDLDFHPGWLERATSRIRDGIGVVGTNDLCSARVMRGEHSTHSLVTREYAELGTIDDPTALLHEAYPHEFVDDEFIQTARKRRAYVHAHDAVVEHLHPMVGKAPMDDLYAAQRPRMKAGARIYRRRQHLWT